MENGKAGHRRPRRMCAQVVSYYLELWVEACPMQATIGWPTGLRVETRAHKHPWKLAHASNHPGSWVEACASKQPSKVTGGSLHKQATVQLHTQTPSVRLAIRLGVTDGRRVFLVFFLCRRGASRGRRMFMFLH